MDLEKLRFDFSWSAALTSEQVSDMYVSMETHAEIVRNLNVVTLCMTNFYLHLQLQKVESIVNEQIRSSLPVFAQTVPFADAAQISSLRKVPQH